MNTPGIVSVLSFAFIAVAASACGASVPTRAPPRASGQSSMMASTFAGANACNPKNHERPFVIEWDGTDASSFSAKAARDLVVVRYEGCDLEILESCAVEDIAGGLGAYGPVEWTSGAVEAIDVANEAELYAKLPLGAATLGGRVSSGEQFRMEYFVSGTRKATRDAVSRGALAKIPGCTGATHFVHAYNLGAFSIASRRSLHGEAGGTVGGIGARGAARSRDSAEKRGGMLSACAGESAREVSGCQAPIRLTLRAISDGASMASAASVEVSDVPPIDLLARIDDDDRAAALWSSAREKHAAGDGSGCLASLDKRDAVNPKKNDASTNPRSLAALVRAECVMLSGRCDAGKAQLRKAVQIQLGARRTPAEVDQQVDQAASEYCRGATMSSRDQLLAAVRVLGLAAFNKREAAVCARAYDTVKRVNAKVSPRDAYDLAVHHARDHEAMRALAQSCFEQAGDCAAAFSLFKQTDAGRSDPALFAGQVPSCSAWASTNASPRDQLVKAMRDLTAGGDAASCTSAVDRLARLRDRVKIDPNDALAAAAAGDTSGSAAFCFAHAGECRTAWSHFRRAPRWASMADADLRALFVGSFPRCSASR